MAAIRLAAFIAEFGQFWRFAGRAIYWTRVLPFSRKDLKLLVPLFYEIGARSVFIVSIVGLFVGMVLAVQAAAQFLAAGLGSYLGAVINLSVVKELGPVLAGVMLAGRVGGAMTAEIGTMNITEQIDALKIMGVDPIRYLVMPRFISCLILTPILTCYADIMGLLGGYLISVKVFGVSANLYWRYSAQSITMWDLSCGLIKSVFFGSIIAIIGCYKGFTCKPGAEGVGRACTEGFVLSFISILTIDFFLAVLFKALYEAIWGFSSIF